MKKLLVFVLLIALAVFAMGRWSLSESGATEFLTQWEDQTVRGDASGMCATLADDVHVSITDHTMERSFNLEGGKAEFCDYLERALPLMSKALRSMNVTRDDFLVRHRPWHWWTADVSYTEHRRAELVGGLELKTQGEDHLVLVKTLSGLRVQRLEAETWKEGAR
jgi:hypothetical protein